MFKNSGKYAKTISALIVYLAGAVPVVMTMSTWQEIAAYVIPGILAVFGVYAVPNSPADPPVSGEHK